MDTERSEPPLSIYADTSDIVPFWARLPKFFVYPLHLGALVMIAVSMGLAYVAQFLPFTFWVLSLISIGFVRYGFAVLEHTARGHLTPENLFVEDGDPAMRPYKLWAIFVLIAFLTF